jgi:hypothetical protein
MRTPGLTLAAALTLAQGIAVAQNSWDKVRSWTGSVTIEASDSQKGEWGNSTMTYKATGDFTVSDDMLPGGPYMQWPRPSVEAMTDPKQAATAYDRWQSRVVASYDANRFDEAGKPFTVKCTADNQQAGMVGVIASGGPSYQFQVTPPPAKFKCSGPNGFTPDGNLQQAPLTLTAPRKAPGAITGTQTFTVGTKTMKVTYNMAPTR